MGILDQASKTLVSAGNTLAAPFKRTLDRSTPRTDFPEGFVIVPMRGDAFLLSEQVSLMGNMMPMVPFKWGGELRETIDYYPGNPEPVVHVLGTKETELTINGRLKADRYPDPSFEGVPYEMTKVLERLRLRGEMLQLRLGDWVRYGFLSNTDFEMRQLTDIGYKLTFTIVSFRPPRRSQTIRAQAKIPFSINDQLITAAAAFQEKYSTIPANMPTSLADILNREISSVASVISAATSFVDTTLAQAEDAAASYQRALGSIKYALTSLRQFRRRIGTLATNVAITSASTFDMVTKYKLSTHCTDAISGSMDLTALLAQMRAKFEGLVSSVPLARHRVVAGDTLQKIALKWYGSADNWKKIMDHNKLTSTALVPGAVLEVPR